MDMENPLEEKEGIKKRGKELSKKCATRVQENHTVLASVREEDGREGRREGNMEDTKEERRHVEEHGTTRQEATEQINEEKEQEASKDLTIAVDFGHSASNIWSAGKGTGRKGGAYAVEWGDDAEQ